MRAIKYELLLDAAADDFKEGENRESVEKKLKSCLAKMDKQSIVVDGETLTAGQAVAQMKKNMSEFTQDICNVNRDLFLALSNLSNAKEAVQADEDDPE